MSHGESYKEELADEVSDLNAFQPSIRGTQMD